ncbi:MAG TPA: hypothetical protein VIC06_03000 [Solirubrobacteraceae bacterium]|jgi:hypothetical protein
MEIDIAAPLSGGVAVYLERYSGVAPSATPARAAMMAPRDNTPEPKAEALLLSLPLSC